MAKRLVSAGFRACGHQDDLASEPRGFVSRGGSLVAWSRGEDRDARSFRIIGAHSDSPNLRVKPRPEADGPGGRRLLLAPYGGTLDNSWLDRDLGLAGRIAVRSDDHVTERLICSDRPVVKIPQLAIHLDQNFRSSGLQLNPQQHLHGLMGLTPWESETFAGWCADQADLEASEVLSWDVMTYDTHQPQLIGPNHEFLSAPRLDNLCSCFGGLESLVAATPSPGTVSVLAIFDHEEVGSTYAHRADLGCGSTIGPTTAASLGIDTIDVGMAQHSMHSARETMASASVDTMVAAFGAWHSHA
ncbi:UNVERIFIED_CONTAM: hypothetical protein GTU68_014931 [Idotea baltica]|nr:hypothetical protein [Idotea baltica]